MTAHLPDLSRPALGALMTPERRVDQLRRCELRIEELRHRAAMEEMFPPVVEVEPLPPEPADDVVLTEDDVRLIVHEELAELLGAIR